MKGRGRRTSADLSMSETLRHPYLVVIDLEAPRYADKEFPTC